MKFDATRETAQQPHGSSDDDTLLDFSANTNPRVPEGVEAVYRDAFDTARSYPAEPPQEFRAVAADYVDCAPEQVISTPGGLAAIRATIALAVDDGDSALVPAPSFAEYAREVRLQGGVPEFVAADSILDRDPTDYALAIVCNPNNPTGTAYDDETLRSFAARCRATNTPLLVDEAFLGFTDRPSLAGSDGVVVARSLTKLFGLPGLRAGFAVASGAFNEALAHARRPWNVGLPALATGIHCMRDTPFVDATRERVRRERSRMREEFRSRFDVHPSSAPFLLLDVGERDVDSILDHARERGIALRDARPFRGLDSHVRIAVREPDENDRLLEVLADA